MKKSIYLAVLFVSVAFSASAQTVLFSEDFEVSPVTNFLNTFTSETQLPDGPSTCGLATRGNTTDFNSINVDFAVAENGTYFLGLNPESPCGGYYNASLHSPTQDFSGTADSVVVSIRYFKSTTLGWGPTQVEVVFDNGSVTDTIRDEFVAVDSWATINYVLPVSMQNATVDITLNLGGGEGVGLDDFTVTRYLNASNLNDLAIGLSVFPNPSGNQLNIVSKDNDILSWEMYTIAGSRVNSNFAVNKGTEQIDLSSLESGNYVLKIETVDGRRESHRITKN